MKKARVINNVAVDVVVSDPAEFFHPNIATQFELVPDEVEAGWLRDAATGAWLAPEPVELQPETPAAFPKVSPVEFKLLFTAQERVAIKAERGNDLMIDDFFGIIEDPRFLKQADRFKNASALIAELDAAFAARDRAEWRQILTDAGLVFEIVASAQDCAVDQQAIDAGVLVPFEDGSLMTVSSALHVDGQEKVAPRKAPTLGQHTDEVLREAGYDDSEIARLRGGKAVV